MHTANVGAEERELIEAAFMLGIVVVIFCTSTLAAGVNLPASQVIVTSLKLGQADLSVSQYR